MTHELERHNRPLKVTFWATIQLKLKPGDPIPRDFKWFEFTKAADQWFAERLDHKYDLSPRVQVTPWIVWGRKIADRIKIDTKRSLGTRETATIMGVPVVWNGDYDFTES